MKKFYLIVILFLGLNIGSFCQVTPAYIKYFDKSIAKNIEINLDEETTKYLQMYVGFNRKNNGILGYRIKIYSKNNSQSRNQSHQEKAKFEALYPKHKAYNVYNNPNFEVFVGDFADRISAMNFLMEISNKYPRAYIVQSYISVGNIKNPE